VEREDSTSLLIATGQAVLLVRCAAMAVVGLIVVAIAPVVLGYGDGLWAAGLFSVGGIVLMGSVLYASRRTICPRCRAPWLQYAFGEKSVDGWLIWLTTFTECPQCTFSVRDAAASSQPHTNT
jgi:hypothetical protein